MAELRLDYYQGEDLYTDGDAVENELLEIAGTGIVPEQMGQADFPVLYHFSKIRENILSWYPFSQGASCLEIGSGCGAITELLCRRMERVVSVELSKRRAEVNFARHRELDGLQIWVGNLNDMQFDTEFDYIILNGVFEYAMSFTQGEDPYGTFLKHIRRFLKPEGVILIAIENRLGLKYFAGAPEDHTDGYFDGIRGYEGNDAVRTFSRGEWEALMKRCGLEHYRFYYPYPDYKFPQEIFTDASLKEQKYGRPTWNFTKYRMALFRETEMAAALSAEGIMAQFANSFLIEMSPAPLQEERVVQYAKLSTDRAPEFSIATVIEQRPEGRVAVKRAMTAEARTHIQKMAEQMDRVYGLWRPLAGRPETDGIVYPFLAQKSLGRLAAEAVRQGDLQEVKQLVQKAAALCGYGAQGSFSEKDAADTGNCGQGEKRTAVGGVRQVSAAGMSAQKTGGMPSGRAGQLHIIGSHARTDAQRMAFRRVFGPAELEADVSCIAPANIDLILDNIFEADGVCQVIDCEWIFEFPVPVPFLIWRAVNELYSSQQALCRLCPKSAFLEEFGISEEMARVFRDWGTYFAENYVSANRLLRLSIPEIGISLEEFRRRLREKEFMTSQLFADTGNGYSEEQKLTAQTELAEGRFSLKFDLRRFTGVRGLRFDPLEGKPCICRIDPGQTTMRLRAANAAARLPEGDLFLTTDPMYQVKFTGPAEELRICGEIRVLSMEDALNRANGLLMRPGRRLPFLR